MTSVLDVLDPSEIFLGEEEIICENSYENFARDSAWSPDGSHILSTIEPDTICIYEVDPELVKNNTYYAAQHTNGESAPQSLLSGRSGLKHVKTFKAGEAVYDTRWYPFMNQADPASCCFLTTCRDHPIHLWDLHKSESRCSYRGYNQYDEVENVNCVSFNQTGDRIYAGSKNLIRVFDVQRPGRECMEIPTCATKKDVFGFKGIVSSLSFNPAQGSTLYAAGTFSNNIALYAEGQQEPALRFNGLPFGVNNLKWSPNGEQLWAGGRHQNDLVCWDIRYTKTELGRVQRLLHSNQRMGFDIDPWGRYLVTGSQDGQVLFYDTQTFELVRCLDVGADCANSVALHPHAAILLSASGQRHFKEESDESESEGEGEGDKEEGENDFFATLRKARAAASDYSSGLRLGEIKHSKLVYKPE